MFFLTLSQIGFGHLFQFMIGVLNMAQKNNAVVAFDLSDYYTRYKSFWTLIAGANWFEDIFVQQYERMLPEVKHKIRLYLHHCRTVDQRDVAYKGLRKPFILKDFAESTISWNTSGIWGPGKDEGLTTGKIVKSRNIVKESLKLNAYFSEIVDWHASYLGFDQYSERMLAVHLRFTDKILLLMVR